MGSGSVWIWVLVLGSAVLGHMLRRDPIRWGIIGLVLVFMSQLTRSAIAHW